MPVKLWAWVNYSGPKLFTQPLMRKEVLVMNKCDFCVSSTVNENGVAIPKDTLLFCNGSKCRDAIKLMTEALKTANLTIKRD